MFDRQNETPLNTEKPSIDDVRAPLERMLDTTAAFPRSILLRGRWGVGKTCLWREVVADLKPESEPLYVSLFGAASVADVKLSLGLEYVNSGLGQANAGTEKKGVFQRLIGFLKSSKNLEEVVRTISGKLDLSVSSGLVADLAFRAVRDCVICFDDLERRSALLSVDEVLGLVETLREFKHCRVVCICNESGLDDLDSERLRKYKERVFDLDMVLDPPIAHVIQYALPIADRNKELEELLVARLEQLDQNNIRVFNRAINLFNMLVDEVPETSIAVQKRALHSLLVLTAAENIGPNKYPDIAFLRKFNVFADKSSDAGEPHWNKLLENCEWYSPDELDEELFYFVQRGVLRRESMNSAISTIKAGEDRAAVDSDMNNAWRKFHDSFENNEKEFADGLYFTTKKHAGFLSPTTVNGAVRVLRDLGHADRSDEIVMTFIEAHRDNPDVLDLARLPYSGEVNDPLLRSEMISAFEATQDNLTASLVLKRTIERGRYDESHFAILASLSVGDWESMITNFDGKSAQEMLQTIGKLRSHIDDGPDARKAFDVARTAITNLCSESKIRDLRIRRWELEFLKDADDD